MPELAVADERALEQLRTVQLLETTVGPRSIRQLHNVLTERSRELLVKIEEDARRHRAVLETVIQEWGAHARTQTPGPREPETRLTHEEILESFVELKAAQAEVLRRAAQGAPSEHLREMLEDVARREDETAQALRELLPTEG